MDGVSPFTFRRERRGERPDPDLVLLHLHKRAAGTTSHRQRIRSNIYKGMLCESRIPFSDSLSLSLSLTPVSSLSRQVTGTDKADSQSNLLLLHARAPGEAEDSSLCFFPA
jgi:hypothetical protein